MQTTEYLQIVVLAAVLLLLGVPLGHYMASVYDRNAHRTFKPLRRLESSIYQIIGVDHASEMTWKQYATALLFFNFFGMIVLYLMQILQGFLPLNPASLPSVPGWLALNTAVSFVTNTNWQAYSGEATMSQFTQMGGVRSPEFRECCHGNGRCCGPCERICTKVITIHWQFLGRSH